MEVIPMEQIDPEARKIAVAWCEVYIPHFALQEKHKLASDIMNYSINNKNKMSFIGCIFFKNLFKGK